MINDPTPHYSKINIYTPKCNNSECDRKDHCFLYFCERVPAKGENYVKRDELFCDSYIEYRVI